MKLFFRKTGLVLLLFITTRLYAQQSQQLKLWYDKPAANWNEALPIGNGRLAAMIFGRTETECIQLNEETIWAGEPGNNIPSNVYDSIQQIRNLILGGKYKEAQDLSNKTFPRSAPANNNYGMQYQPAGNLIMQFPGHADVTNYKRELDISNAIATTTYRVGETVFKREIIAALPGAAIVVRITANKPSSINCILFANTPHKTSYTKTQNRLLLFGGTTSSADNKIGRIQFETQVLPKPEGGSLTTTDTSIVISNANALTIFISIGTNFKNYHDISGDAGARATSFLNSIAGKKYEPIKAEHIRLYKKYFDRVSLYLGDNPQSKKPTDARVREFNSAVDPQLVALYFQFGRYLMIAGSQPNSQPTNLQGK
ncbi:MAG TPA: glycoside hydrolase family 95 protein, partial [Chitinophagaceae bacterium]|nr:glycoside hydrolase family 95 protein [Chitinophagaceae bacterium]